MDNVGSAVVYNRLDFVDVLESVEDLGVVRAWERCVGLKWVRLGAAGPEFTPVGPALLSSS